MTNGRREDDAERRAAEQDRSATPGVPSGTNDKTLETSGGRSSSSGRGGRLPARAADDRHPVVARPIATSETRWERFGDWWARPTTGLLVLTILVVLVAVVAVLVVRLSNPGPLVVAPTPTTTTPEGERSETAPPPSPPDSSPEEPTPTGEPSPADPSPDDSPTLPEASLPPAPLGLGVPFQTGAFELNVDERRVRRV